MEFNITPDKLVAASFLMAVLFFILGQYFKEIYLFEYRHLKNLHQKIKDNTQDTLTIKETAFQLAEEIELGSDEVMAVKEYIEKLFLKNKIRHFHLSKLYSMLRGYSAEQREAEINCIKKGFK